MGPFWGCAQYPRHSNPCTQGDRRATRSSAEQHTERRHLDRQTLSAERRMSTANVCGFEDRRRTLIPSFSPLGTFEVSSYVVASDRGVNAFIAMASKHVDCFFRVSCPRYSETAVETLKSREFRVMPPWASRPGSP